MSNNPSEIIRAVCEFYKNMYDVKEVFNKSYFKYTPEEVMKACASILGERTNQSVDNNQLRTGNKKKPSVRDSILDLTNEDDLRKFYLNELAYDKKNPISREECLKRFSTEEFKVMYNLLYSSAPRSKARKDELLTAIEKYFESIDRARSMKP